MKQSIPDPGQRARYEILRSCYFELAQSGSIAPIREPSKAATHEQQMPLDRDEDEDELASRLASPTRSLSSSSSADRFYTPPRSQILVLLHSPC